MIFHGYEHCTQRTLYSMGMEINKKLVSTNSILVNVRAKEVPCKITENGEILMSKTILKYLTPFQMSI